MIDLSKGPENLQFVSSYDTNAGPAVLSSDNTAASLNVRGPRNSDGVPSSGSAAASLTPAFLATARHPGACIAHIGFKILSFLCFLFGSFLFGGWRGDYVFTFVTTTILLSVDFWVVKNVTGRLLVGMRWWNHVRDDGTQSWVYEAHTDERVINTTDKTIFWTALYVWPLLWVAFFLFYFLGLKFDWLLLVCIAIALSTSNLIGYWNCSKETQARVQQWAASNALRSILGRFF